MPHSYKELIKSNPDETEIRSFLVDGKQVSVTLRIPDALRDAAKEEAAKRTSLATLSDLDNQSHRDQIQSHPNDLQIPKRQTAPERLCK